MPLPDYERCHLFPLQWGDEAAEGFMYAHSTEFNKGIQKRLENFAREWRDTAPPGAELRVEVTALTYPRDLQGSAWGDVLQEVSYKFTDVGTGRRWTIQFNIEPPPGGKVQEVAAPFTGGLP